MDIVWDEAKNRKLKQTRGISFEDVGQLILDRKYVKVLEKPVHPKQMIFVISYRGYTHVVPFVIENDDTIVLKTVFPSRKFHKLYGKEKP